MGHYNTFRAEVKSILEAVQLSGSTAFAEVAPYPTNEFSGHPAASVYPAEVVSDYITVAQNQRGYGLMIDVYHVLDQQDWAAAWTTACDLMDLVIDALDQSIDLNGEADFLRAVPVSVDVQESGQGLAIFAQIHAVAIKDVQVKFS